MIAVNLYRAANMALAYWKTVLCLRSAGASVCDQVLNGSIQLRGHSKKEKKKLIRLFCEGLGSSGARRSIRGDIFKTMGAVLKGWAEWELGGGLGCSWGGSLSNPLEVSANELWGSLKPAESALLVKLRGGEKQIFQTGRWMDVSFHLPLVLPKV